MGVLAVWPCPRVSLRDRSPPGLMARLKSLTPAADEIVMPAVGGLATFGLWTMTPSPSRC
jgi:hypothetical protein